LEYLSFLYFIYIHIPKALKNYQHIIQFPIKEAHQLDKFRGWYREAIQPYFDKYLLEDENAIKLYISILKIHGLVLLILDRGMIGYEVTFAHKKQILEFHLFFRFGKLHIFKKSHDELFT
jgi:hypothetical protein